MGNEVQKVRGARRRRRAEEELPRLRKAGAEVAAYADCTENQMTAMFGWTAPKMPAHYIAQANREKLAMTGMGKIVAFDQSQSLDDFMSRPEANSAGTSLENGVVTFPGNTRKKSNDFNAKRGFMVRSEGARICWEFNRLTP
jgi:hypothetical protein